MTPTQLAEFARRQLSPVRGKSGEVLYSGAETLRPGPLYLLGHNPGGDPRNRSLPTIRQSIDWLPTKPKNSYLDTKWSGRDTLQVRVIWLLAALGLHPRYVAAANLCFVRSRDAKTSKMREYAELCWPVHEKILDIVQPSMVIAYGNSAGSPYEFLSHKFGVVKHGTYRSGHGAWSCRTFDVPGRFRVVGLPHLSRYDITAHPEVVRWIKSLLPVLAG
jgi:hypothetical protein